MKRNKIIVIGTSPIVKFHIEALRKVNLEPIAIASSNINSLSQKKFAKKNKIKKNYSNWKKMINEEKYSGIVIATRTESTIDVLKCAIKQNVPILVEKPISFNSKQIKKITKNSHKMIIVGYNRRFYETVNYAKKFVLKNKKPVLASMTCPEKLGKKNFFNNTSHSIDILRYIFGEIKLIHKKRITVNNIEKGLVATFSNNRNDIIQFIGNWEASDNFSLSIFKDSIKIELKPYEELCVYNGLKIIEPTNSNPIRKYTPKLKNKIGLKSIDKKLKPGFFQQSKEFAKLIESKIKTNSSATLIDAYKNIEICEKLVGKY